MSTLKYLEIQAIEIENLIHLIETYRKNNVSSQSYAYFTIQQVLHDLEDYLTFGVEPELDRIITEIDEYRDEFREEMLLRFRGGTIKEEKRKKYIKKINDYTFDLELLNDIDEIIQTSLRKYDIKNLDRNIERRKQDFRNACQSSLKILNYYEKSIRDELLKNKKQLRLLEIL